jgi:hypothetical protein
VTQFLGIFQGKFSELALVLTDSPFYTQSNWSLGDYKQNMSFDSALQLAGKNAFHFGDEIEITLQNATLKLYFYKQSGERQLYSSEILFH